MTQFYEYQTMTQLYSKLHHLKSDHSSTRRALQLVKNEHERVIYLDVLEVEKFWEITGSTYCKISPKIAWEMCNTNVDIPATEIPVMSNGYSIFAMLFASQQECICDVETALVAIGLTPEHEVTVRLFTHRGKGINSQLKHTGFSMLPGSKIETAFLEHSNIEYLPIFRIAICTAFFLADQHEVVMPDLTRKEIIKYRKAKDRGDQQQMQRLKQKAANRNGYVIGSREIDLPAPRVTYVGTADHQTGTGRELQHAHIRRGHMRHQPVGKREEKKRKLIWLPPTVVRPDLPMNSNGQGYRIPDPPKGGDE